MIEGDWLSLVRADSLYLELTAVAQPRKLFRLGLAFLDRVRERLPTSSDLVALDVTEEYIAGRASYYELAEAWTKAEHDGGEGIWTPYDCLCDCCNSISDESPYLPGCVQYADDPAGFAAHAAFAAMRLVGGFYQHRLYTVNDAMRAEAVAQHAICRDLLGDETAPPRPSPIRLAEWPAVRQLVAAIDRQGAPDRLDMLVLADALEEAGCKESRLLKHLRANLEHYRGCWAVERVAGREMIELAGEKPLRRRG